MTPEVKALVDAVRLLLDDPLSISARARVLDAIFDLREDPAKAHAAAIARRRAEDRDHDT